MQTGLQISELIGVIISDVSLLTVVVQVIGIGKKERLIPPGEEAVYWIENYLKHGCLSRPWLPMTSLITMRQIYCV